MGAARPQTQRRSPRQAFGGKRVLPHLGGKKTKQQNKLRIFSYEVSHLRGQVKNACLTLVAVRYAWAGNLENAILMNRHGLPVMPFRSDQWFP